MAGSRIPVETVLTIRDINVVNVYVQAAQAAEKYSAAAQKANEVGKDWGGGAMLATSMALGAIVAGATAATTAMVGLNSEAEKNRNKLAGDIKVYGYAQTYADGLLLADKYLQKIREDAAALPGEDSDFIRSFGIAFPAMAEKGKRSLNEMVDLSNKLTAVLVAKGVDPSQIGRDIGLMVRGRAGMDVRSFVELQSVLGGKKPTITTEEWNKLKDEDRFKRLEAATSKFDDSIKAFATTWEAVSSTAMSYIKEFGRTLGAPLFEAVKRYLDTANKAFEKHKESIMLAANMGMTLAVQGGEWLAGRMSGVGSALIPKGYATSGGADKLGAIFDSMATAGLAVLNMMTPLAEAVSAVESALMGVLGGLAPSLANLGEIAVSVSAKLASGFLEGATQTVNALGPALSSTASLLGDDLTFVTNQLIIGVGMIVDVFVGAYGDIKMIFEALKKLMPGGDTYSKWGTKVEENKVGDEMSRWWKASSAEERSKLGVEFMQAAQEEADRYRAKFGLGHVDAVKTISNTVAAQMGEAFWSSESKRAATEDAERRARGKKPPTVTQDFRGSKFNIAQRFDKEFEPGRILTAIREDAATLASRRLRAGITPLFGTGG